MGANEPSAKALWREVGLIGAELRTAGPLITRSSPLALPLSNNSSNLWVKSLAVGLDTLLMVVVNDDYLNDRDGTRINPVLNAVVKFVPPAWLEPKDVFEIHSSGTKDVPHNTAAGRLELDLSPVQVTRLVVVTRDPVLRQVVQRDYEVHFAANVRKLQAP